MDNKNSREKFLEKIEQEKIAPKPYWHFLAQRYSVSSLVAVTVCLGSLAFSLIMFLITDQDWSLRQAVGASWLRWLFLSLPFAWLAFLVVFLVIIYFSVRHFRRGYKYPAYFIVIASLVAVIMGGSLAASLGLHRKIHSLFTRRVPFYFPVFDARVNNWERPLQGLIVGRISAERESGFQLSDFHGRYWEVLLDENTVISDIDSLSLGEIVKVIGRKIDDGQFSAQEIRLWEPGEKFAPGEAGRFHPGRRMMAPGIDLPPPIQP